jgi:hypothetical protein
MKSKKFATIPLAKGQLWKMVPISLGGIVAVQAYLRTNGAKLIRKAAALKA